MGSINKVDKRSIDSFVENGSVFICFSSFEERCCSLARAITPAKISKAYIFRNVDKAVRKANEGRTVELLDKFAASEVEEVSLKSALPVAEKMHKIIKEQPDGEGQKLVVDISTFTHEALLILISLLKTYHDKFDDIKLIYNGASEYASWLSKGCREVRNVIGYPGRLNPSKTNRLVLLTGFEYERATRLVELMEPDVISLGNGIDSTSDNHIKTMEALKEKFNRWAENLLGMSYETFDFSCSKIDETVNRLNQIVDRFEEKDNIIMVPLNTKLSTLSLAFVAMEHEEIQVIYPIPEVYNTETYSKASDNFTIIDLKGMLAERFGKQN